MGLGIFQSGLATNRKSPPESEGASRPFTTMRGAPTRIGTGDPEGQGGPGCFSRNLNGVKDGRVSGRQAGFMSSRGVCNAPLQGVKHGPSAATMSAGGMGTRGAQGRAAAGRGTDGA